MAACGSLHVDAADPEPAARPHSRASIFEPAYSEVIRRLSALSADICALFPGRVPRHIRRHIFAVIRSLSTLILLQANNTNKY